MTDTWLIIAGFLDCGAARYVLPPPAHHHEHPYRPASSGPSANALETARTQIGNGELREAAQTLNTAQRVWFGDARIYMLAGLMAENPATSKGAWKYVRKSVAAGA